MVALPFVPEARLLNAPKITVVGSYATGLTMKVERLPCRARPFWELAIAWTLAGKDPIRQWVARGSERESALSQRLERTVLEKRHWGFIATNA